MPYSQKPVVRNLRYGERPKTEQEALTDRKYDDLADTVRAIRAREDADRAHLLADTEGGEA